MKEPSRKRITQTAAALVALTLVLSVLGPVGTVAAVDGITVNQQADSTTVTPGDTITFTTEVGVDGTQIDANSIGLQTNVYNGALPDGWEVTSRGNVENFIPGPDGFLWFVPGGFSDSATATAQYTVSVPDDADPGDYDISVTASTEDGESTTETTTITVESDDPEEPAPPALPGQSNQPTDPDGDGRYEDVDGNGDVTFTDVVELFEHFGSGVVENNADAFDFNENERLDFDDIIQLFLSI